MEDVGSRRYLIHIERRDGSSLFLHPFTEHQNMVDIFRHSTVAGVFGREPEIERIRMFREHLYSIAYHDARVKAVDRAFVPRFVSASGSFLMLYWLFIVFPLPWIPELVARALPFVMAIAVYTGVGLRYSSSAAALSRATQLRGQIDEIRFDYSESIFEVEEALHELEHSTQEEILHFLRRRAQRRAGLGNTPSSASPLANDLAASLEKRLKDSGALQLRRSLDRWIRQGDQHSLQLVARRLSRRTVDLPLLALFLELRQQPSRKKQTV